MEINFGLKALVSTLGDDVLVGPEEVGALTGYATTAVQQRRVPGLPDPLAGLGRLRWHLGDLRKWIRAASQEESQVPRRMKMGRPTKEEQIRRRSNVELHVAKRSSK